MDRIQNQTPNATSLIGKTNEAESSTSSLRQLTGCFNSSASLSDYREKTSFTCDELRRLYLGQDKDDILSGDSKKEKTDAVKILSTLNSERNRKDFQILNEYIEGGNGSYKTINDHLRKISPSLEGQRLSDEMKEAYSELNYYNLPAYRSAAVPTGTYGGKIKINDVVIDDGFMSASAIPKNSLHWLETWTSQDHGDGMEKIIFVFDETASKKMAAGGMLPDHILIAPNTPLKVKEIHITDGRPARDIITVVKLKHAEHPFRHDIKDIFSGDVKLTATDRSVFHRLAHIFESRDAVRHEDAVGRSVIGNRYPGTAAQNETAEKSKLDTKQQLSGEPDIRALTNSLATSSNGAVNVNTLSEWLKDNNLVSLSSKAAVSQALRGAGVVFSASQLSKAWAEAAAPEKSASAPAAPPASLPPYEVNRLRKIFSLTELKEQSGRRDQPKEEVRNALLEAAVPLADVARHPGKEILEVITGDEITGSNYSQNSEALSGALAANYFTAFEATITDEDKLSGDAAKSLLESPLREYLTEHRGQINMHRWIDGFRGAVNTPAVSQQHGKAVRALFTELETKPAIGTAWAPGEPASALPGVQQMTERLRGLASSQKAAEEKLTTRVAERDVNIRVDTERMARIRAQEKAKRQETDRHSWISLQQHFDGIVKGGEDLKERHARIREGINARFSEAYHARMDAYQQDREVAALKLSAMLTNLAEQLNSPARRSEAEVNVAVSVGQSVEEDAEAVNEYIASRLDAIQGEVETATQTYSDGLKNNLPEHVMTQRLAEMERVSRKLEFMTQRTCEHMGFTAGTGWAPETPSRQAVDALMQAMEKEVIQDRLPDVEVSSRLPDVPQRAVRERGKEKIQLERSAHDKLGYEYQGPTG
jgi:hypothetical protein